MPQRTAIDTKVVETRREHFTDVLEELRKKGNQTSSCELSLERIRVPDFCFKRWWGQEGVYICLTSV